MKQDYFSQIYLVLVNRSLNSAILWLLIVVDHCLVLFMIGIELILQQTMGADMSVDAFWVFTLGST